MLTKIRCNLMVFPVYKKKIFFFFYESFVNLLYSVKKGQALENITYDSSDIVGLVIMASVTFHLGSAIGTING